MRYVLLPLLVFAVGCGGAPEPAPPKERLVRVETTHPVAESLPIRVELTATVEALSKIEVSARVPGVVAEFYPPALDIGQRVSAGAPIVRLAVPELDAQREQRTAALAQAKNQVAQAAEAERVAASEVTESEALLKRATADVKFRRLETRRVTDLASRGATQPERVEEANRQLEATEAAADAARAAVDTKKAKASAAKADRATAESRVGVAAADLRTTEEMITLATIKAPPAPATATPAPTAGGTPFQYVVTRRTVDRGATIKDAGQPLLTLMHVDTVRVLVDIPERDVPMLEAVVRDSTLWAPLSESAVLQVPGLRESASRGEYRGRIARTAGVLDPATRSMRAEVEIDNRAGDLKPGMYGTMTLTLGNRLNALMLPSSAFVRRDGRTEVLVVDVAPDNPARGVIRVVEVRTGYDDGKRVQVTSGLTTTDRVVVRGNTPVQAGDAILPVEVRPK